MKKLKRNRIIVENGRPKAIILDLKEYRKLKEELNELRDALDIKQAKEEDDEFIDYDIVREELKKIEKIIDVQSFRKEF